MNESPSFNDKRAELASLKTRVQQLEAELAPERQPNWPPRSFYNAYYLGTGTLLGGIAAAVSLLANVIGAPLAGKSPLELIRVYLTFPLGEKALSMTADTEGLQLAIGCCLYLFTGMILGVPMYWLMVRFCGESAPLRKRLIVASVLAIGLWLIGFYGILTWLQPLLFGGNWITDPARLPIWVAAGTHLIFGWVIALLHPWGQFTPYSGPSPRPTNS
jgi:hypothetical protein